MARHQIDGFDGELLHPGDGGYDAARAVWNAMVDRRPAAIARSASPSDVAAAVRYGRASGLEIGVRCGGHSILGLPVVEGGLTIDLTPMGGVRVDPERRRAWVRGGALLGALDRAAQAHGLATTAGNVSHTGVGGLTLGGGMGWLARQHGLSCDNVASYELVTADGSLLRVTESDHADLFWGLRGGGGNFGVVTEFEFRLHPVAPTALVVERFFTPDAAIPALRAWRSLLAEAPRRATLIAWAGRAGEWPFLPVALRGGPAVSAGYVWVGDLDEGRALLPAFRALGPAAAERVRELTYVDLQRMDDDVEGHALRRYWKGHFLRELPDEAIEAFVSVCGMGAHAPSGSFQLYAGAIGDVADGDSAYSQRDALVEFISAARWTDPVEDERRLAAARRYGAGLEPFASGVYVNSIVDEGEAGVRRAYRADKLARLTALKDRYDPDNVFHRNQNIRPSSWAAGR